MNLKISPIKFNNARISFQSRKNEPRINSFAQLGDFFEIDNSAKETEINSAKEIAKQEDELVKDRLKEMKAQKESGTIYYSGNTVEDGIFYETYDGTIQIEKSGHAYDFTGRALFVKEGKVVKKVRYKEGKIVQELK